MGDQTSEGRWCILRTSAARTLPLTLSLSAVGLDVWTPAQTVTRRQGRKRDRVERTAPIVPTFVFARADDLPALIRMSADPISPHSPFSLFRHRDRIPLIADGSLGALRDEERRQQRRHLKTTRKAIAPGTAIRLSEGAFAGMTGVVERGGDKQALVNFGGGFVVTIATYLLESNVIQTGNIAA